MPWSLSIVLTDYHYDYMSIRMVETAEECVRRLSGNCRSTELLMYQVSMDGLQYICQNRRGTSNIISSIYIIT